MGSESLVKRVSNHAMGFGVRVSVPRSDLETPSIRTIRVEVREVEDSKPDTTGDLL